MNEFEKACNEVDDFNGETTQENAIEFLTNAKTATVCFSQGRYISKIKKLAEQYPEECEIVSERGGAIVAHIPVKWIKISKVNVSLTEEQKKERAERLRKSLGR